ncbi:DUF2092 domain-containing protein [Streptomyces sp. HNM0574]|nr:DUF2092 domain-containing protein [Streptomyces sp. HNM0574]
MPPQQPAVEPRPAAPGRRKAVRYGVPVAVAGLAAATVGFVPALASAGAPDLPKISAEELVAKMASSDVQQLSGTVRVSTDLGLPELPGMSGGSASGAAAEGGEGGLFGGPQQHGAEGEGPGDGAGRGTAPQDKLMQLASGEHTLRVAADGPDKQRLSVVEDTSEYSLIRNGGEVWAYDSGNDTAHHAKAPAGAHQKPEGHGPAAGLQDVTPKEAARQALKAADETTSVTVDGTANVAGRDAYQLVIAPKGAPDSTVEAARIAVDAENGTPLKFTLNPKDGGKPAVDIAYTKVDFAKPEAGTFDFTPPKGTEVIEQGSDGGRGEGPAAKPLPALPGLPGAEGGPAAKDGKGGPSGVNVLGEGWGSIAKIKGPEGLAGAAGQGGQLLDSFTEKAKGEFGTGRVVSTRLVNALLTDDGTVYVGAVTKEGLIKAAEADSK